MEQGTQSIICFDFPGRDFMSGSFPADPNDGMAVFPFDGLFLLFSILARAKIFVDRNSCAVCDS